MPKYVLKNSTEKNVSSCCKSAFRDATRALYRAWRKVSAKCLTEQGSTEIVAVAPEEVRSVMLRGLSVGCGGKSVQNAALKRFDEKCCCCGCGKSAFRDATRSL